MSNRILLPVLLIVVIAMALVGCERDVSQIEDELAQVMARNWSEDQCNHLKANEAQIIANARGSWTSNGMSAGAAASQSLRETALSGLPMGTQSCIEISEEVKLSDESREGLQSRRTPTPGAAPTEEPTAEVEPTTEPTQEPQPTAKPTIETVDTAEPEPTVRPIQPNTDNEVGLDCNHAQILILEGIPNGGQSPCVVQSDNSVQGNAVTFTMSFDTEAMDATLESSPRTLDGFSIWAIEGRGVVEIHNGPHAGIYNVGACGGYSNMVIGDCLPANWEVYLTKPEQIVSEPIMITLQPDENTFLKVTLGPTSHYDDTNVEDDWEDVAYPLQ